MARAAASDQSDGRWCRASRVLARPPFSHGGHRALKGRLDIVKRRCAAFSVARRDLLVGRLNSVFGPSAARSPSGRLLHLCKLRRLVESARRTGSAQYRRRDSRSKSADGRTKCAGVPVRPSLVALFQHFLATSPKELEEALRRINRLLSCARGRQPMQRGPHGEDFRSGFRQAVKSPSRI